MKTSLRMFLSVCALCAVVGFAGCENDDEMAMETSSGANAASMGMINETCPIRGGAVNASVTPAEYKGHKIGFCCPGCEGKWANLSADEKDAYVEKSMNHANMGVINGTKKSEGCGDCSGGSCHESAEGQVSPGAVGKEAGAKGDCGGACSASGH